MSANSQRPDHKLSRPASPISDKQSTEAAQETPQPTIETLKKLSSAVEQCGDNIVITDRNGNIEYVNPAFEKSTGYTKDEAIGKTPRILKSGKYARQFYQHLWGTILSGQTFRFEFVNKKRNGEYYNAEETIAPIKDDAGNITHFIATGKDVTTRKLAEEALIASKERYHLLFERNPLPLWVYDLETLSFLDVNEAAIRHYGYSREEFLSMTIKDIRPPETIPFLIDKIRLSGDGIHETEPWRHRKKDGSIIFVEITSHEFAFAEKKARLVLSHDVTDRITAEHDLLEVGKKYQGIFDNATVGIFQSTPEGKLLTANSAAAGIYGYDSAEDFISSVTDIGRQLFVNPQHRKDLKHLLAEHGSVEGFEFEAFRKDRTRIWVSENVRAVSTHGRIQYYEGFLKDITERKQVQQSFRMGPLMTIAALVSLLFMICADAVEEVLVAYLGRQLSAAVDVIFSTSILMLLVFFALRKQQSLYRQKMEEITERRRAEKALTESEERFRQITETISEVFWMSDVEFSKILYVSPAYEKIWGRTCQSLYEDQLSFMESIHPEDRERAIGEIEKKKMRRGFDQEYRIIRPDGTIRWIWNRGFPIRNPAGEVSRIAGIAEDITQRKLAEEEKDNLERQLLQSQKIEAIGQLAGGVAHDFNNILMVVEGYSELLMLKTKEKDSINEIMEIKKAARQGGNLTRQLLAFSRRQVLSPKVLNLKESISNMEDMLQRLIGEDIQLKTRFSEDLGRIEADPGQIEQVILNLSVNARDAMPDGGKLAIEVENVDLVEEYISADIGASAGLYVMLSVSDTGCGMNEQTRSRIFEPFFTTKPEGKGTGLGLSTVYGIVKQSGGSISVDSQPQKGTRFKIYFPRVRPEQHSMELQPRPQPGITGHGRTILFADDNAGVRSAVSTFLELKGYTVLQAANGMEAIELAKTDTDKIDLLISDVIMPEMNGRDLARFLRENSPSLKVLFMSGYAEDAVKRHGVLERDTAFLSKPVRMETLLLKISELLQ